MERLNILMFNHFTKFFKKTANYFYGDCKFLKIKFQPLNLNFPEVDLYKIRMKNNFIRQKVKSYKKTLLDELLIESGMNKTFLELPYLQKRRFIFMDINILKEKHILPKEINITERLVSILDPFPYDPNSKVTYIRKIKTYQTIKGIRDSIERQFLAWKFQTNLGVIRKFFCIYSDCFVAGRSMNSINKNVNLILETPKVQSMNTASKMYLLTIKPLDIESIEKFEDNLVGVPWDEIAGSNPRMILKPFDSIMLLIKALREKKFTEDQIRVGLPYFKDSIPYLIFRLNFIILSPELSVFRTHEHFLLLLSLPLRLLQYLSKKKLDSFAECLKHIKKIEGSRSICRMNSTELYILIDRYLDITPVDFNLLHRYSKSVKINPEIVMETIKFLKAEFTIEEILESINIILYPKQLIEIWLQNIRENPKNLKEAGFECGNVSQPTNIFECGTKLQNKSLQLCLYFIDKHYNFTLSENYKPEGYMNY